LSSAPPIVLGTGPATCPPDGRTVLANWTTDP